MIYVFFFFFFQAEDGIRDRDVTGVQTCALPIWQFAALSLRSFLKNWLTAKCVSACVRKMKRSMFARFARNSAAAGTHWPLAPVFSEASPRSKERFWRKFVESLSANPDGVLLVDKAEGMTSHDVVALARRKLATKKIGHCGTLDPIATGLLLLTIGRGTKVQD